MNSNIVFILTEAGKNSGYGHISRCSALGDELVRRGADVRYIVNGEAKFEISSLQIADWTGMDTSFLDGCLCIIDSYLASEEAVASICRRAKRCLCIDDNNIRGYSNCIVVNPALHAESLNYTVNKTVTYLLGSEYIILREPFRKKTERDVSKKIREITITLGGTDVLGLTPVIIRALENSQIIKNIVVGKNTKFPALGLGNIMVHNDLNAEEMHRLFLRSDLVISAGGQTIYELVQCRTPGIFICVAHNQRRNVSAAIEYGFGIELNPSEAGIKINTVLNGVDYGTRLNIAGCMKKFDFSHGVENIIDRFYYC